MFLCVTIFSGTINATIFKLGISIDNELLYRGIENWAHCFYSYLYLSILLSLQGKFVPQVSQGLCKLQTSKMAYIWRTGDCIKGLRFRLIALIFPFFSIFLSIFWMLTLKNVCRGFLRNY